MEEVNLYTPGYIQIKSGDLRNSKKRWRAFDSCPADKGMWTEMLIE
jgi:hypothetical protein